ncbi:DMT family transporter [Arthrobacter sp. ERGS1:01]|uniref:DMT family transporter n=1 Tax=Arthrobacter sp. ERGS1:01 TaxID=1704044 RepID=UPI0006B6924E|nr:DMT family transporter [Arthrobacter sp. ERGS1:01]
MASVRLAWLRRPDVLMVLTSAPTYVATSEVLKVMSPLDLTPIRFLLAAAIIGVYFAVRKRRFLLRKPDVLRIAGISILGYGAYGTLLNLGQTTVPAGTVSLLLNTSPVFAFVLGYLVLGERTSRRGVLGMGIATAGVAIITVFGPGDLGFDWNALVILAAALILAVFLIWQQPLLARIPPVEMVFWGCLIGGISTLPVAKFDVQLELWNARTVTALVVLVVCSTVLAYSLWNLTLSGTSVAEGGSLLFAVPVFSLLLGWMLLGQMPTAASVIGGCIALGGVLLLSRAQNVPHHPDKEEEVMTTPPVVEDVIDLAIREEQANALSDAVAKAVEQVGARLATISLWRPATADLVRVYTSLPEIYRLGGISAELGEDWTQQCVVRLESFIAESPAELQTDAFEHHDTLAALRLGAGINAVIDQNGHFLGCLNLMDSPGSYTHEHLRTAQAIADGLAPVLAEISATMAFG